MIRNNKRLAAVAMMASLAMTGPQALADELLFSATCQGLYSQSNADGSNLQSHTPFDWCAGSFDIDVENQRVWFTDRYSDTGTPAGYQGRVGHMNFDGSDRQDIFSTDSSTFDLRLDTVNDKIYWTELSPGPGELKRADLDGSNVETLYSGFTNWASHGFDLDPVSGKIYFSSSRPGPGQSNGVITMNLDGSNVSSVGGPNLYDVSIDVDAGFIFGSLGDNIYRMMLDGSGFTQIGDAGSTVFNLYADTGNDWLYFSVPNSGPSYIGRMRYDGSDFESLYTVPGQSTAVAAATIPGTGPAAAVSEPGMLGLLSLGLGLVGWTRKHKAA